MHILLVYIYMHTYVVRLPSYQVPGIIYPGTSNTYVRVVSSSSREREQQLARRLLPGIIECREDPHHGMVYQLTAKPAGAGSSTQ